MKIKLQPNHTEEFNILASSPWVKAEGLLPHRIVLRLSGKAHKAKYNDETIAEFVVHTEVQHDVGHGYHTTYFTQGDYTYSVRDAWAFFCERSNDLMEKAHKNPNFVKLADAEGLEVSNV